MGEGARWNRPESRLDESEPKKLFISMPIIYVTGTTMQLRRAKGDLYSPYGYDCAVYKYPKRNDRYLVFRLMLRSEQHPSHWKLRGVSLMCAAHERHRVRCLRSVFLIGFLDKS